MIRNTVYVVRLSNGKFSGVLGSIPDATTWIEENWEDGVKNAKITSEIRNVDKQLDGYKLEENRLKERLAFVEKERQSLTILKKQISENGPKSSDE